MSRGACRAAAIPCSTRAAGSRRWIAANVLRDLFARDRRRAGDFAYVSSPLRRARETMELLRTTLGLDPAAYAVDDRLMEISYGDWEGLTLPEIEARMPGALAERERDKWDFMPPGGESYRELTDRISEWYAAMTRDTVVAAHGGGVRALMALFNVVPREEATHALSRKASSMCSPKARCRAMRESGEIFKL